MKRLTYLMMFFAVYLVVLLSIKHYEAEAREAVLALGGLTGGCAGCLDKIDTETVSGVTTLGSIALSHDPSGNTYYLHQLTGSGKAEDSPYVIKGDTQTGALRWELIKHYYMSGESLFNLSKFVAREVTPRGAADAVTGVSIAANAVDSAEINTDAVKDDEMDYAAVTLADFLNDISYMTATAVTPVVAAVSGSTAFTDSGDTKYNVPAIGFDSGDNITLTGTQGSDGVYTVSIASTAGGGDMAKATYDTDSNDAIDSDKLELAHLDRSSFSGETTFITKTKGNGVRWIEDGSGNSIYVVDSTGKWWVESGGVTQWSSAQVSGVSAFLKKLDDYLGAGGISRSGATLTGITPVSGGGTGSNLSGTSDHKLVGNGSVYVEQPDSHAFVINFGPEAQSGDTAFVIWPLGQGKIYSINMISGDTMTGGVSIYRHPTTSPTPFVKPLCIAGITMAGTSSYILSGTGHSAVTTINRNDRIGVHAWRIEDLSSPGSGGSNFSVGVEVR